MYIPYVNNTLDYYITEILDKYTKPMVGKSEEQFPNDTVGPQFLLQIFTNRFLGMKFPHVMYMTLHIIWENTFHFAWSALEFVEFDGIKEWVQKAILERNFTKFQVYFIPLVWLMHKDEGNEGFGSLCQIKLILTTLFSKN